MIDQVLIATSDFNATHFRIPLTDNFVKSSEIPHYRAQEEILSKKKNSWKGNISNTTKLSTMDLNTVMGTRKANNQSVSSHGEVKWSLNTSKHMVPCINSNTFTLTQLLLEDSQNKPDFTSSSMRHLELNC
jgi:hypothetical protein